jgi:uncharacterized protein YndB with AHSA1/START domain
MTLDVVTEIVIGKPPSVVAEFAANPDNAPKWYVNIKSVEWQSEPGVRVGARAAFVAQFMGRRLAYTYEIVAFEPGARLVMRTAEGPFPMETSYTWEPGSAGSTKMRLRNRGTPSGFSFLMQPLMSFAMRAANRKDLACLKKLLETS